MDCFATSIMRSGFARHPAIAFEPVQQRHQGRLFNAEMGGNLCLRERTRSNRQMHQCPPFGLTQTHRFEPLVQFQPPGSGRPVQKRAE